MFKDALIQYGDVHHREDGYKGQHNRPEEEFVIVYSADKVEWTRLLFRDKSEKGSFEMFALPREE